MMWRFEDYAQFRQIEKMSSVSNTIIQDQLKCEFNSRTDNRLHSPTTDCN